MPNIAQRACSYPGCPVLVLEGGRCGNHPYQRQADTRPSSGQRGYDRNWQRLRAAYLKHHPRCEIRRKCRNSWATEVDHKVPLEEGGTNTYDNLQSACKPCHSWKTASQDTRRDAGGRFTKR